MYICVYIYIYTYIYIYVCIYIYSIPYLLHSFSTAVFMNNPLTHKALHVADAPVKAWPGPAEGWKYKISYSVYPVFFRVNVNGALCA